MACFGTYLSPLCLLSVAVCPFYQIKNILNISTHFAHWDTLSRLARPDLVILRLALYELEYTQVPNAVAINEALRLAHDFSDEKSYRFINGVLGSIESEQN